LKNIFLEKSEILWQSGSEIALFPVGRKASQSEVGCAYFHEAMMGERYYVGFQSAISQNFHEQKRTRNARFSTAAPQPTGGHGTCQKVVRSQLTKIRTKNNVMDSKIRGVMEEKGGKLCKKGLFEHSEEAHLSIDESRHVVHSLMESKNSNSINHLVHKRSGLVGMVGFIGSHAISIENVCAPMREILPVSDFEASKALSMNEIIEKSGLARCISSGLLSTSITLPSRCTNMDDTKRNKVAEFQRKGTAAVTIKLKRCKKMHAEEVLENCTANLDELGCLISK